MRKNILSLLLAAMMLLGLAVPAFAEGEQEAPPTAEIVEEAPQAEEAPPASDEIAPAEDAVVEETVVEEAPAEEMTNDDGIMPISDEPMTVAAGGVTVSITGSVEGIDAVLYNNNIWTDAGIRTYYIDKLGIRYFDINNNTYWVEKQSSLPLHFEVYPGCELEFRMDPQYGLTVDNGVIVSDISNSLYLGEDMFAPRRIIKVTAPSSGTLTVNVAADGAVTSKLIPYTLNCDDSSAIVGGEDWGSSSPAMKTLNDGSVQWKVNTGGEFSVWVAPGYAIEMLKGGYVVKTEAPSGPAAASVPAGSTSYVLHVDLEADEFVIAAVKQGEHFQAPDTNAPQAETPPQTDGTFTDVTSGVWYEDTVMSAYEKGIVKGVTENTFSPNSTTTRGQTVTMLYRAMGSPSAGVVFSDTSGEVGFAAGWASANGVTNGVSTTAFAPNSSITREQLVTMLYRLAGSPAVNTNILATYSDGSAVQGYAQNAVAWAITNGLLTGYGDGTIHPSGVATRAEVCALIMRYLGAA